MRVNPRQTNCYRILLSVMLDSQAKWIWSGKHHELDFLEIIHISCHCTGCPESNATIKASFALVWKILCSFTVRYEGKLSILLVVWIVRNCQKIVLTPTLFEVECPKDKRDHSIIASRHVCARCLIKNTKTFWLEAISLMLLASLTRLLRPY